jgi:hypothetical protein
MSNRAAGGVNRRVHTRAEAALGARLRSDSWSRQLVQRRSDESNLAAHRPYFGRVETKLIAVHHDA